MFKEKESRAAQPQSGNAAWKAAAKAQWFKPGRPGLRLCCVVVRSSGKQCGQIAMKGIRCCYFHGGKGQQALVKQREAKRNAKAKASNANNRSNGRRFKQATIERGS